MAELTIPIIGLSADAALLYDQRHVKLDNGADAQEESLHYISIPINLKYTLGLGSLAGVYVATGPQFMYNVGNSNLFTSISGAASELELSKSQFSWNIGLGVKLLNHLQAGYNYNIGLGNTGEFKVKNAALDAVKGKLKNNTHQISVAYLF